jgi:hypothetical protein
VALKIDRKADERACVRKIYTIAQIFLSYSFQKIWLSAPGLFSYEPSVSINQRCPHGRMGSPCPRNFIHKLLF